MGVGQGACLIFYQSRVRKPQSIDAGLDFPVHGCKSSISLILFVFSVKLKNNLN